MKCRTKFCRGYAAPNNRLHSPYCSKCRSRRWKAKHPLHYLFNNLRHRAKLRGIEFTLTRNEFIEFAHKTNYEQLRGRNSFNLCIDRKDSSKGYSHDNIRALTIRANSARVHYKTKLPEWLRDEIAACENGSVPESHQDLKMEELIR